MRKTDTICLLFFFTIIASCKMSIKQQEDRVYSRHLQRHVELDIISAGMPEEKASINLLLYNNFEKSLEKLHPKEIIDSLYSKNKIEALVLVSLEGTKAEYTGEKAEKFNMFIENELLPFIKKKDYCKKI